MKRIVFILFALILSLSLFACGNNENGTSDTETSGSETTGTDTAALTDVETTESVTEIVYTASHSSYNPDDGTFDEIFIAVTMDGIRAEVSYGFTQFIQSDVTEVGKSRFGGNVKQQDGYYVITVDSLYDSLMVEGDGAKNYVDSTLANIDVLLADESLDEETKQEYRMMKDLYSGKEVDSTYLLENTEATIKIKVDENIGKVVEFFLLSDLDTETFLFEYDEQGVMISSKDEGLCELVEYYPNGVVKTDTKRLYVYRFDEQGNLISQTVS